MPIDPPLQRESTKPVLANKRAIWSAYWRRKHKLFHGANWPASARTACISLAMGLFRICSSNYALLIQFVHYAIYLLPYVKFGWINLWKNPSLNYCSIKSVRNELLNTSINWSIHKLINEFINEWHNSYIKCEMKQCVKELIHEVIDQTSFWQKKTESKHRTRVRSTTRRALRPLRREGC